MLQPARPAGWRPTLKRAPYQRMHVVSDGGSDALAYGDRLQPRQPRITRIAGLEKEGRAQRRARIRRLADAVVRSQVSAPHRRF